jgi:hypothetical protein
MGADSPQITYRTTPDYFDIDAWDGPDEGAGPTFNYNRCPGATWGTCLSDLIDGAEGAGWRPWIHMPRWASRISLRLTAAKIERLQDISEDDAGAEGMREPYKGDGDPPFEESTITVSRWRQYRNLWNRLHTKPGATWLDNPPVIAFTFEVVQEHIDKVA